MTLPKFLLLKILTWWSNRRIGLTGRDLAYKWGLYGLALLPLCFLQTVVLTHVPLWGVRPMLLPLAAAVVAVLEGAVGGAGYGIYVGAWCELLTPGSFGLQIIGFCLLGVLVGSSFRDGIQQTLWGCFLCTLLAFAVLDLARILLRIVMGMGSIPGMLLLAGSEILWSMVFFPVVYWIYRWSYRRVGGLRLM